MTKVLMCIGLWCGMPYHVACSNSWNGGVMHPKFLQLSQVLTFRYLSVALSETPVQSNSAHPYSLISRDSPWQSL